MTERFEEPEPPVLLAAIDRRYHEGERPEQLALERSIYRGHVVYWLRLQHRSHRGWSWSEAKPSANGRYFSSISLRRSELLTLGNALIAEAERRDREAAPPEAEPAKQPRAPKPREARELARLDAHPVCNVDGNADRDSYPF